ncbi:peptidylprolyl isomerase [Laspinema olomoucense]|uniref:peptidylprolyl isomerase n=1 Tax=Laspinema olomoucense TaxID=3231600 RepID=UPI0021BB8801|nr:peptidylprolyl isomerase [Laspinema sp. D3a]MCT7991869.1 peptidylprolyl isomerase [Laspinema sp. D3a]
MEINIRQWIVSVMILGALLIGGCAQQEATSQPPNLPTEPPVTAQAPDAFSNLPRLEGKAKVRMVIKGKPVIIEVDGTNAPITAGNFVDLVQRQVYDGSLFHRVVRTPQPFVAQGGDPQSKNPKADPQTFGTGGFIDPATGQERSIPLEITPEGAQSPVYGSPLQVARINQPPVLKHKRGAVAMARSQAPDSASSQFYFALSDLEFLDGNYAVFGQVLEGMDVVDGIQQGDRIDSAEVIEGLENLRSNNPSNGPS